MTRNPNRISSQLGAANRVAANGLIDRRIFLQRGAAAGLALAGGIASVHAESIGDNAKPWQKTIGAPLSAGGSPSRFAEGKLKRGVLQPYGPIAPGSGASMTPLHELHGTITPSGLHFERHHNGVPEIDPEQHTLTIHGLVKRPLVFDMDALMRYPMVNRICFIECSGNSFFNAYPKPRALPCGMIHGLVSCSEWAGIPLSVLLDEAGIDARAKWIVAEGADFQFAHRRPVGPGGPFRLEALIIGDTEHGRAAVARMGQRLGPGGGRWRPVDRGDRDRRIIDDAVDHHVFNGRVDRRRIDGNLGELPGKLVLARQILFGGIDPDCMVFHDFPDLGADDMGADDTAMG